MTTEERSEKLEKEPKTKSKQSPTPLIRSASGRKVLIKYVNWLNSQRPPKEKPSNEGN
jgi:hypothetical protein